MVNRLGRGNKMNSVLPNNCVMIEQEEMVYLDGGWSIGGLAAKQK